jgi:glutamate/aspartate transport system substrate-binding protein
MNINTSCWSHILCHLLLAATTVIWANPATGETVLNRMAVRSNITLGYRADSPPFSYEDSEGAPIGYSLDICKALVERIQLASKRVPQSIKLVSVDSDRWMQMTSSGAVDLMCSGTSDTPARRDSVAFTAPIFFASARVLVRTSDQIKGVNELADRPLVVIKGTTAEKIGQELTARRVSVKMRPVLNGAAALAQLQIGWAAGYLRDDALLLGQLTQDTTTLPGGYALLPDVLSVEQIAIAYPKGDPAMDRIIHEAMKDIIRSGSFEKIYAKWFMRPIPPYGRSMMLSMPVELKRVLDTQR